MWPRAASVLPNVMGQSTHMDRDRDMLTTCHAPLMNSTALLCA